MWIFPVRKFLVFHQFSFTPKFIHKLLKDSKLTEISVANSPSSEGDPHNLFPAPAFAQYVKRALFLLAQAACILSCGKIYMGTSLEVTAVKPKI
jgi:hypothetical protein